MDTGSSSNFDFNTLSDTLKVENMKDVVFKLTYQYDTCNKVPMNSGD